MLHARSILTNLFFIFLCNTAFQAKVQYFFCYDAVVSFAMIFLSSFFVKIKKLFIFKNSLLIDHHNFKIKLCYFA